MNSKWHDRNQPCLIGAVHAVEQPDDDYDFDDFEQPIVKPTYIGPFVNVYLVDRAYGGPEEGGWWYDFGKLIRSTQILAADAEAKLGEEQLWCEIENNDRHADISSVLSDGRYVAWLEDEPGCDWPAEVPHYE